MKPMYLFLFVIIFSVRSGAQNHQVGLLDRTFVDSSRSNRPIPCKIYYPSATSGNNTPVAAGQFPVLVFGHGFVMPWSAYDIYWLSLVPQGYIVVFPTTESSLSPNHLNFGKDLAYLCRAMREEGNKASSPFHRAVDSTCAVMGHSMGGGCAYLAMQTDPSITALVSFAAAVTNPSSVRAASAISKPALVFSGANDCVTPPAVHQIPMYDSLASLCKSFISITGGDHCQFASYNFNCSLGQSTCSPKAAIDAARQQGLVFGYLLPWLNFYLKGDCSSGDQFQDLITGGNGITARQNCTLECVASTVSDKDADADLIIYPNPCDQVLTLQHHACGQDHLFSVMDMLGRNAMSGTLRKGIHQIDVGGLSEGHYVLVVHGSSRLKFVIRRK